MKSEILNSIGSVFFNNLINNEKILTLTIISYLHFISHFLLSGLTIEQIDCLWFCLVTCLPDFFHFLILSWLLKQTNNEELHALGLDSFKHIFVDKVPVIYLFIYLFIYLLFSYSLKLFLVKHFQRRLKKICSG